MSEWLPIAQLFNFEKGTLQSSKCTAGDFTFITASADWKTHNAYTHDTEALVFAMAASGSLGRTHYVNGKFIASDLCFILTPKTDKKIDLAFYFRVFNFIREDIVKKTATGTSKLAINQSNFGNYKLPYFDFEHQVLFREKIDKISAIKNGLSDGFSNQKTYLTQLRQAILQEAIEGKLTADWRVKNPVQKGNPDHDAQALLETIKAEKQKLMADGKIKKEKPLAPINPDDVPFALPDGWVWVRLGEIIVSAKDGPHFSPKYSEQGIPFISTRNISVNGIDFTTAKYISEEFHLEISKKCKPEKGDVLYTKGGTTGIAVVNDTDIEFNVWVHVAVLKQAEMMSPLYIKNTLNSPHCYKQSQLLTHGIGNQDLGLTRMVLITVPLPPLAEQNAIVERVDRLLESVNALELQVTERKSYAQQLMQAVLKEAFAG